MSDEDHSPADRSVFNIQERPEFFDFKDLPTFDDRLMPNPLENPPDESEVGTDISTIGNDPQLMSMEETIEGKLLATFQTGNFREAELLLSQIDGKFHRVKSIVDVDKKTLLHLACQGGWTRWLDLVKTLVERFNCDVSAVDEDGNTPLHVASNFGSKGVVKYLLTHESCQPNAVNKDDYTALRIAVEKGHRSIVRTLLSSGRVDPTIKDKYGHTLLELMKLRHPSPLSENEGSSIQMVEQFIKCIENNSDNHQPFTKYTHYCLLDILRKLFKNRDAITVKEMLVHIMRDFLPLPEEASEIVDLLVDLQSQTMSHQFFIFPDTSNFEDTVISETEYRNQTEQILSGARSVNERGVTSQEVDHINLTDSATVPDLEQNPTVATPPSMKPNETVESDPAMPVIDEQELKNLGCKSPKEAADQPPGYKAESSSTSTHLPDLDDVSDDEDMVRLLQPDEGTSSNETTNAKKETSCGGMEIVATIYTVTCCLVCTGLIVLGFCGFIGFQKYPLIGSTAIQQIRDETVLFIGKIDISAIYSVSLDLRDDNVLSPISLYLVNCTNGVIVYQEPIDIMVPNMSPPLNFINRLDERYMLNGSCLTFNIDILSSNSVNDCIAILVVFDNATQYLEFIDAGTWTQSYREYCVGNSTSMYNLMVNQSSYYYTGLLIENSLDVNSVRIEIRIAGNVYKYNADRFLFGCSVFSTSCTFKISDLNLHGLTEVCILGSIPSISINNAAIVRSGIIDYSVETVESQFYPLYFFIPFLVVTGLVLLLLIVLPIIMVIAICVVLMHYIFCNS